MMNKIFSTTIFTAFLLTSTANANEMIKTSERNPRLKPITVEVKLLDSLASAVPGLASGGLSLEYYLGQNFALQLAGSYADVDLPMRYVNKVTEETNSPMIQGGNGYSAGLGLRYYDAPIGDSLYGGLIIDYSEANNNWKFNSETYDSDVKALTTSLSAGYRWVWENGFLLRFGAGAGVPTVLDGEVTRTSTGPASDEGKRKIDDLIDSKVVAKIDLGIGMMF